MQAEQKRSSGYLSSVAHWLPSVVPATLHGLSSYVPDPVKRHFPAAATSSASHAAKEQLLWSSFHESSLSGERRLYLLLGLMTGVQVWDLKEMKEVYSKRDVPIRSIHLWDGASADNPNAPKSTQLILLSTGDDPSFPRNQVKIYSTQTGEYTDRIRFDTEVYSICVKNNNLFVSLRDEIHAVNLTSLKTIATFPCYPNRPLSVDEAVSSKKGVFTASTKWIAYASSTPEPKSPEASSDVDTVYSLAKDFANGIYTLGDFGARKVSNLIRAETNAEMGQTSIINQETQSDTIAGTVIIRDIETQEIIAHFKAHEKQLDMLKFDHSGALLATASISGNHINIYKINPGNPWNSATHLYKFSRGMISAQIHDISFSADGKWLTVLSNRGTAHIFALNPHGGIATPESHARIERDSKIGHYRQRRASITGSALTISANPLARVKDLVSFPLPNQQGCSLGVCMFGLNPHTSLLLLSNDSTLFQYKLNPGLAPKTDAEPYGLVLEISEPTEWSVGRFPEWKELIRPLPANTHQPSNLRKSERRAMSWAEQIEMQTSKHMPDYLQSGENVNFFVLSPERSLAADAFYETQPSCMLRTRQTEPVPSFWNDSDLLMDMNDAALYKRGETSRRLVKDPRDELLLSPDSPTTQHRQLAPVVIPGQPSLEHLLMDSYMRTPTTPARLITTNTTHTNTLTDAEVEGDDSLGASPATVGYVGPVAAFGQRRHSTSSSLSEGVESEGKGTRHCDIGDEFETALGGKATRDVISCAFVKSANGDDICDDVDDDDDGEIQTIGDRMEMMGYGF